MLAFEVDCPSCIHKRGVGATVGRCGCDSSVGLFLSEAASAGAEKPSATEKTEGRGPRKNVVVAVDPMHRPDRGPVRLSLTWTGKEAFPDRMGALKYWDVVNAELMCSVSAAVTSSVAGAMDEAMDASISLSPTSSKPWADSPSRLYLILKNATRVPKVQLRITQNAVVPKACPSEVHTFDSVPLKFVRYDLDGATYLNKCLKVPEATLAWPGGGLGTNESEGGIPGLEWQEIHTFPLDRPQDADNAGPDTPVTSADRSWRQCGLSLREVWDECDVLPSETKARAAHAAFLAPKGRLRNGGFVVFDDDYVPFALCGMEVADARDSGRKVYNVVTSFSVAEEHADLSHVWCVDGGWHFTRLRVPCVCWWPFTVLCPICACQGSVIRN